MIVYGDDVLDPKTLALVRGAAALLDEDVRITEDCDDALADYERVLDGELMSVETRNDIVCRYCVLECFYPERFWESKCERLRSAFAGRQVTR